MGLYDYVRSSYPLPAPFMGLNQTKDIDPYNGGSLQLYWIDPAGYLWTSFKLRHVVCVYDITQYIEIYPEVYASTEHVDYHPMTKDGLNPSLVLHFEHGKLLGYAHGDLFARLAGGSIVVK